MLRFNCFETAPPGSRLHHSVACADDRIGIIHDPYIKSCPADSRNRGLGFDFNGGRSFVE